MLILTGGCVIWHLFRCIYNLFLLHFFLLVKHPLIYVCLFDTKKQTMKSNIFKNPDVTTLIVNWNQSFGYKNIYLIFFSSWKRLSNTIKLCCHTLIRSGVSQVALFVAFFLHATLYILLFRFKLNFCPK